MIFTDCSMPFMDGYECTKHMIGIFNRAMIPDSERPLILAVTGHVESEYQRKAVLCGMSQVYSKPIRVDCIAMILLENKFKIKIPPSVQRDLEAKKAEETSTD